jgi:primosomal protein N' (replication factor Y)
MVSYLRLKVGVEEATSAMGGMINKSRRQTELLEYLIENPGLNAISEIKQKVGSSPQSIKALIGKNLVEIKEVRVDRDPIFRRNFNLSFPLSLTSTQESVLKAICASLQKKLVTPSQPDVFLLRGVTGSGKTEVYIHALGEVVKLGKRGIVLVPEIAMTPQIIDQFVSRFPGKVAVLHSQLSLGEQFDEWWRIKSGEFDVVIGTLSAIFDPQPDL